MGPLPGVRLDVEAISGILGSISIACWVVVFTPQIIENFQRSSADGLSLTFLLVWLLGDVFNILGAVLQGVLPTMIVLAVYYTLADIVLLLQCFYYRGFTLSDAPTKAENGAVADRATGDQHEADEESPLLNRATSPSRPSHGATSSSTANGTADDDARRQNSLARTLSSSSGVDVTHLSPATPLLSDARADPPAARHMKPTSTLQSIVFNSSALVLVCVAGAFGWWLSVGSRQRHGRDRHGDFEPALGGGMMRMLRATTDHGDEYSSIHDELQFDTLGQVFGYLCAIFYLGSRLPQLLLNYRRQSTEGVSILFFLFACVGNLTYVLSILAYDPLCYRRSPHEHDMLASRDPQGARGGHGSHSYWANCEGDEWWAKYGWYMVVNLSWLIGSAGTLFLDFAIFVQFWMYKGRKPRDIAGAPNGNS